MLTELDEEMYENDSSFDSDDDDIVKPKKKVVNYVFYENNIENEKDYDTDLEGYFLCNFYYTHSKVTESLG